MRVRRCTSPAESLYPSSMDLRWARKGGSLAFGVTTGAVLAAVSVDCIDTDGLGSGSGHDAAAADATSAPDAPAPPSNDCSGGDAAAKGLTCLPTPEGWQGPFLLRFSSGGPALPCAVGQFTTARDALYLDAAAAPAACDYKCGAIAGSCTISLEGRPDSVCSTTPACDTFPKFQDVGAACAPFTGCPYARVVVSTNSPTCPSSVTTSTPPITAADRVSVCDVPAGTVARGCSGTDRCVQAPAPGSGRLCVLRAGKNAPCPAPTPYVDAFARERVHDARGCQPGSCAPDAVCTLQYSSDSACTVVESSVDVKLTNECVKRSAAYAKVKLGGACAASGPGPTGGLEREDVTVCCAR